MSYDRRRDVLIGRAQSAPATKDRRRWCGGRAGRAHNIEVAIPPNRWTDDGGCEWRSTYALNDAGKPIVTGRRWWCTHVYRCATCGKQLDRLPPAQCPDKPREPQ